MRRFARAIPVLVIISAATAAIAADTCAETPLAGCRRAEKSALVIKAGNSLPDSKDKFLWKWMYGESTTASEFGNLSNGDQVDICMYDSFDTGFPPYADYPMTGDGIGPHWSSLRNGWVYKDKDGSSYGITTITLKSGVFPKIIVKARGALLPDPVLGLPFLLPVTVQMVSSTGLCWESIFTAARKNEDPDFKAKAP